MVGVAFSSAEAPNKFNNILGQEVQNEKKLVFGMAIGVAIGTAIGVSTDNLGLWISLGIAIGAALGFTFSEKKKKDKNDNPDN